MTDEEFSEIVWEFLSQYGILLLHGNEIFTDEMTKEEKQIALLNAVLEAGNREHN